MRKKITSFNTSRSQLINVINEWVYDENHREILILRYAEHKTYQEIAEIMDYSITTVGNISRKYENFLLEKCNKQN